MPDPQFRFLIDPETLVIGNDRVVRYADTQSPNDPLLARYINEAAQLLGIESSPVNEKQD